MFNDNQELYLSAVRNLESCKYELAIESFNLFIEKEPNYSLAYLKRGIAKFYLQNYPNALKDINRAIKLDNNNYDAFSYRGRINYFLGKYKRALTDVNKSLSIKLKYDKTFVLRCVIKAKLGYFQDAINDRNLLFKNNSKSEYEVPAVLNVIDKYLEYADEKFQNAPPAILSDLNSPKTYYVIALLHSVDEEYSKALIYFNKTIDLCLPFDELLDFRDIVKAKKNNKKFNKLKSLKMEYFLYPNYNTLFELSKESSLYYDQYNDEDDSLIYINQFLEEDPYEEEAGEAYYYRANAYFWSSQYREAAQDYTQAIRNYYDFGDVFLKRAECYFNLNYSKRALRDVEKALAYNLNDEEFERAYFIKANVYHYNLKDYNEALINYEKVFEKNNSGNDWYEIAHHCRAEVLFELKKYDASIKAYNKCLNMGMNYVYLDRGKVYLEKGEYEKAISDFDKAINKFDEQSDAYYYRSCAKRELGKIKEADLDFYLYQKYSSEPKLPFLKSRTLEYYKRNNKKDLNIIENQLQENPQDYSLYQRRAIINIACKNYSDALDDLNKTLKLNPLSSTAYLCRANVKGILNDIDGKYSDLRQGFMLELKKCTTNINNKINLYLYRPLDKNTFSILTNNYLWFSHPSVFNDPLDSKYYQNAVNDNDLLKILQEVRIRSFTHKKEVDNVLLWSHYAEKHNGIAIEYEIDIEELKKQNIILCKVYYCNSISQINNPKIGDYGKSFFIKSTDWSYENEWRMVTLSSNLIDFNKLYIGFKIKSVVFGLLTKNEDIETVKKILGKNCKYYKMDYENKIHLPFSIIKKQI